MEQIRVLIVDDHQIVREGLKILLECQDQSIVVVGEASGGVEAVAVAVETNPDVILMDIYMPDLDGVDATRKILRHQPNVKIIMLTTFDEEELLVAALQAGAVGYLLKALPGKKLVDSIRMVADGGMLVNSSTMATVMRTMGETPHANPPCFTMQSWPGNHSGHNQTTPSELAVHLPQRVKQILVLMAEGKDNNEISDELHLSGGTVRNYASLLYERLGVRDRAQAILYAQKHGLL